MKWKRILINDDKPDYYHGVKIIVNGIVYNDWHKLSDGENEYYGPMDTSSLITEKVTHWTELDTETRSVLIEKMPHEISCRRDYNSCRWKGLHW